MAAQTKKHRWVDILLIVLSGIPFLNSYTLLHFGGRTKTKKWTRFGWIILFLNIVLILTMIMSVALRESVRREYPESTRPNVYDYVDRQSYDNSQYDERTSLPGYDEYLNAKYKWEHSEAYLAADTRYRNRRALFSGIHYAGLIAFCVVNLVTFFYVISQKNAYFEKCDQTENARIKSSVYNRLEQELQQPQQPRQPRPLTPVQQAPPQPVPVSKFPEPIQWPEPVPSPATEMPSRISAETPGQRLDINTATEDQLAALPGLTIIDAKKAIAYRDAHGGFADLDAFFAEINAKPHIIVRLQDQLTVSAVRQDDAAQSGKRQLDI